MDKVLEKIHTRSISMVAALILITGGLYMCVKELTVTGKIDLKTALIHGQIETGSLGLMSMFLGVVVILVLNIKTQPYKGQEVELEVNGNTIRAKGLSYRKLKEITAAATAEKEKTS